MGIGRGRRRKAAQQAAAAAREAVLDRLEWQLSELRASLDKAAAFHAIMRQELDRPVPFVW
jgi:hypothetical protein